ncbi:ATP-binding protein [candidate division WOR-3 bacterium]|nr:ATP-binding protein [candidate division WOR-3 bacterium]
MQDPIAITIGTSDQNNVLARMNKKAELFNKVQLMDFIRIKNVIGRITKISDSHDYSADSILSNIAKKCLKTKTGPSNETKEMLYKRLEIEPLGTIHNNGELSEYEGNVGYFESVFKADDNEIGKLYPNSKENSIPIGYVASGYKTTQVPFKLDMDTALSRHIAVFGKNGTGKTNFLKELIGSNLQLDNPVPMLVFGHPDLGVDNPNDNGTRGLSSLESDKIVLFGYDKRIKLSPEELSLGDIFDQFDMSTSMRDLWMHMQTREPNKFIEILAKYDVNADPYKIHRQQIPDPKDKGETKTVGISPMPTVDAVSRQARILANYIDSKAPPIIAQILLELKRGKTVLVNTFNMTEYYQGLFVKLLLNRLQRAGKSAMHKKIAQRYFVIIDEAQHFISTTGDKIKEFIFQCRKFGVTLLLSTQSPASIPASVYGQIYSTISFHLNKADLKVLVDYAPLLEDCKSMILRPPLKKTLGLAIVQAVGYPYPAAIKVPHFERRFQK